MKYKKEEYRENDDEDKDDDDKDKNKEENQKNNPKGCYRYMTKHLYEVHHYLNPIPLPAYANTFSASDNKGHNINSSFKAIDYTIKESYATTN